MAVERSGSVGHAKTSPDDDNMPGRRAAFSIDEDSHPKEIAERKNSIAEEFEFRKNSVAIAETIPESALETPRPGPVGGPSFMSAKPLKKDPPPAAPLPIGNPDKITTVEEPDTKLLPGDPTDREAVSGGAALKDGNGILEQLNGNTEGKAKVSAAGPGKPSTAKTSAKPSTLTTAKISTSVKPTKSTKSLHAPKTPTTSTKDSSNHIKSQASPQKSSSSIQNKSPVKAAEVKAEKASHPPTAAIKTARPSASTSPKGPTKKTSHTSLNASAKPRPRSPTKPVKLPSSLTAPTAASASKLAGGRQSLAPSTGTSQEHKPAVRAPPTRTSLASKPEPRGTKANLAKTANSSHASLTKSAAPTLQKQPSKQSLPKQSDDSFLARMMRPTASSASKTHEKVTTTPPKPKPTSRPVTREGAVHHKPGDKLTGSPSSRKLPPSHESFEREELKVAGEADTAHAQQETSQPADARHEEPVAEENIAKEHIAEEHGTEEHVTEESTADESQIEGALAKEPISEKPADKPIVEESTADDLQSGELVVEEPVVEKLTAEEPIAEKSIEEPITEELETNAGHEEVKPPLDGEQSSASSPVGSQQNAPSSLHHAELDSTEEEHAPAEQNHETKPVEPDAARIIESTRATVPRDEKLKASSTSSNEQGQDAEAVSAGNHTTLGLETDAAAAAIPSSSEDSDASSANAAEQNNPAEAL